MYLYYRGQSGNTGNVAFRRWYNNIQELRSLLPRQTPFIALTATAMKSTREKICSALNMDKPELVMASPERPNICYAVVKMSNKIHVTEYFEQLLHQLKTKGNQCDRCIIYCQTVNQCSTLFSLFSVQLGQKIYLHEEKPNAKERLVEMMHARTPDNVKETVLNSMADYEGNIRVLICTIAFGMGVDAKGVRTIINFGPSRNLGSYVQESGRCSRDGKPGKCIALYLGRMLSTCAKDIKDYVSTKACRRQHINGYFERPISSSQTANPPTPHDCCDNCALSCTCGLDGCSVESICSIDQAPTECISPVRNVSEDQFASLKRELMRYKKTWVAYCMQRNMHSQSQVSAISWPSFLLEFGDYHIGQVIESAPYIASWSDVLKCIEVWRVNHAIEIWKILKKIFPELQDEQLPEIPDVATDIDGDEDEDDNDWMRMLNDSFNDFSFTAMLEEEESMDVDEDASYEAAIPDILDTVLSSI